MNTIKKSYLTPTLFYIFVFLYRNIHIGNISKSEIIGRVDRILSPKKDKGKVK